MTYQHSEGFANLKVIKEDVKTNFTTYQYLQVLDHFIESAIDPLVTASPSLVDNYFAKVISWQTHRPSIKFSRNPKASLPAMLFNSLTTEGKTKRKFQKEMLLNRGLLFGLLSVFRSTVNNYKKLHDPSLKISKSKRLNLINLFESKLDSSHLYSAILQSDYWASKAYWFKELIMQKYVRLALMNGKNTYTEINHAINLDDIIQIYLSYLSKAVDRCDSRQGVLTTFIQTWFFSAKAEIKKMANETHSSSSYEELMESGIHFPMSVDPDLKYEELQHISFVAKSVDPDGCIRYSLAIPEFISQQELKILKLFTTPQIGV